MKNDLTRTKNILLIFIFFCVLATLLIFKLNYYHGFIPDWDESHHLTMGFNFYKAFKYQNWDWIRDLLIHSFQIYPPIYHLLIALCFQIFGVTQNFAIFSNIPFIFVLMISVYSLGCQLGNSKAGLFAAIITPILPVFLALEERVTIDYASISIFIASFYFLFKTDGFTKRKYSIFFALTIFVELLVKWPFIVPSIPFIVYAITSLFSRKNKRKQITENIVITIAISILGLSWYIFNFKYILSTLGFYWNPNGFAQLLWNNPRGFTLQNILLYAFYYPIRTAGIGINILLLFYLSLFLRKNNAKVKYLLSSIAVTYLVLTCLDDKSAYYIAYVYPLIIIIISLTLFDIKNAFTRNLLIGFILVSIVINFSLSQFNYIKYQSFNIDIGNTTIPIFANYETMFPTNNWPTAKIATKYLSQLRCKKGVLIFPDNRFLNFPDITFLLLIKNINTITKPAYTYYNPAIAKTFDLKILDQYSCILTKTGDPGIFSNTQVMTYVNRYLLSNMEYRLTIFNAPDNSFVFLYIKNADAKE